MNYIALRKFAVMMELDRPSPALNWKFREELILNRTSLEQKKPRGSKKLEADDNICRFVSAFSLNVHVFDDMVSFSTLIRYPNTLMGLSLSIILSFGSCLVRAVQLEAQARKVNPPCFRCSTFQRGLT